MRNKKIHILLIFSIAIFFSCHKDEDINKTINEPYDKVITALSVHNNDIWVGTSNNGLYKLENDSWINYTQTDGLLSNEVTAIVFDNDEKLWVGSKDGISIFENGIWNYLTAENGLFNNDIRSLECDAEDNIWIGSRQNRVTKFDGTNFTTYHVNPEISGEPGMGHIHTLASDMEGNIWVGSCISGLSKFNGTSWLDNINDITSFVQSSICAENGDIWIGHLGGASIYCNETWTDYSENNGLSNSVVLSMDIDAQQNIWIGTKDGISKFDGSSWMNYIVDSGPINDYVSSLACDPDGSIWVGNNEGLLKFDPN